MKGRKDRREAVPHHLRKSTVGQGAHGHRAAQQLAHLTLEEHSKDCQSAIMEQSQLLPMKSLGFSSTHLNPLYKPIIFTICVG